MINLGQIKDSLILWWYWDVLAPLYKVGILKRKVTGYMCKTDFDCELGSAMRGNVVYPSVEDLKRSKMCTDECGIVEVMVTRRRIVQAENYKWYDVDGNEKID